MMNLQKLTLAIVLVACSLGFAPRSAHTVEGTITTVAGNGTIEYGGENGSALLTGINYAFGVALDGAGNIFIADHFNHRIRRVDRVTGLITTVAGSGEGGYSGDNGPATSARLYGPTGLHIDKAGTILFADVFNQRVRRVDGATGIITTVAGNGARSYSGDNGPATSASFDNPRAVAADESGNIFIADLHNHRIRRVDQVTGIVTTVAGNGTEGYSGDGGPATSASFYQPFGVAVDGAGNLFIADSGNARIRRVDHATGLITTVVGTGMKGYSGDNGPATAANLYGPYGIFLDKNGNIFISDSQGNRVRRVDHASGIITTVAGDGVAGYSGDNGPATNARIFGPTAVFVDGAGNIYIADAYNYRVRRVEGSGTSFPNTPPTAVHQVVSPTINTDVPVTLTATDPDGPAPVLTFRVVTPPLHGTLSGTAPNLTYTPAQNYYGTDSFTFKANDGESDSEEGIISIYVIGNITTVAGNGFSGFTGDNIPATDSRLRLPLSVVVDSGGTLFIADDYNHRIRRVDPATGLITTVAGNGTFGFSGDNGPATQAQLYYPNAVFVDGPGNIFIADTINNRIRRVDQATGLITTVAGNGRREFSGDGGPATAAGLDFPQGLFVDDERTLFIADTVNNRIRRVDGNTGVITTVAGNGLEGFNGDDRLATTAGLYRPQGVFVDKMGNIFISDSINNRIRRVDRVTRLITTVAGTGEPGIEGDFGPAIQAKLSGPSQIFLDDDGNIFIADARTNRIRRVDSLTGIMTTVAGNGVQGYGEESGPATSASFYMPTGVVVDRNGTLFIADAGNNRIRRVGVTDINSNTAPVAENQEVSCQSNNAKPITLVATDADSPAQVLTYTVLTPPAHGTLSGTAPELIYTPNPDYVGPDSFTFIANDGLADSNTGTVSITVTPSDNPQGELGPELEVVNTFYPLNGQEAEVRYRLDQPSHVSLTIYDRRGQEIITLVDGDKSAGPHVDKWSGRNSSGNLVAAGYYHVVFKRAGKTDRFQIIILK